LVGDALFKLLIELGNLPRLCLQLLGSLAQFFQEPRILDGDDGLRSEVGYERDLSICEWVNL
jgi:hypothetical protein